GAPLRAVPVPRLARYLAPARAVARVADGARGRCPHRAGGEAHMIRQLERDGASSSLASLVDVTYRYPDATVPSIDHCSWEIGAGEMLLVAGASGSGKSTLLRTLNGLVPHFSGGRFGGS